MGSKGGGSPIGGYYPTTSQQSGTSSGSNASNTANTGATTGSTSPNPIAYQAYLTALQNAAKAAATPYQPYSGQQVAGFTPDQMAAMQGYRNMANIQQPYLNASEALYNQAVQYSDPANFTSGALQQYMNPYQQSVVDATLAQMKQNQDVLTAQNTNRAVRSGSYGGSGQFLGQAEIARQQALSNAQTLAGLNQSNYQQAASQYNTQRDQAVRAAEAAAQGLSGLGTQAQNSATQAMSGLLQSGSLQQQLAQQQLTNAYNQWLQAKAYPYQQASYFGGLASGLGPQMGAYTTGTQAGQSSTAGTNYGSYSGSSLSMQPYANQSGGGGLAGIASTGLGILGSMFGLKDGGVANEKTHAKATGRKHYEEGGTDTASDPLASLISSTPYSSGATQPSSGGFASLLGQHPFQGGSSPVIAEAAKLYNLLPHNKGNLEEDLKRALMGLPDTPKGGEVASSEVYKGPEANTSGITDSSSLFGGSSGGGGGGGGESSAPKSEGSSKKSGFGSLLSGTGESGSGLGSLFGSGSEGSSGGSGFDLGSMFSGLGFEEGGRVNRAGGGKSISDIISSPSSQDLIGNLGSGVGNYNTLISEAMAMDPGPQQTPEQQGMPSLPSPSYYKTLLPNYNVATPIPSNISVPTYSGNPASSTASSVLSSMPFTGVTVPDLTKMASGTVTTTGTTVGTPSTGTGTGTGKGTGTGTDSTGGSGSGTDSTTKTTFDQPAYANFINNMYQQMLGRNPSTPELENWLNSFASGASTPATFQTWLEDTSSKPSQLAPQVQGYFSSIKDTTFNPRTGLFNLAYQAPYYSPQYKKGGRVGKAAGGALSGSQLYQKFLNLGANEKEAALLTGNAKAESNLNPYVMHDNNTGFGLWGHGKDRWADMQKFTGQKKPGWEDQAKFALHELRNSPKTSMARSALARANSPQEIAIAGMHFERPRGYKPNAPWLGDNYHGRLANIQAVLQGKDLGSTKFTASPSEPQRKGFALAASPSPAAPSKEIIIEKVAATPATEVAPAEKKPGFLSLLASNVNPVGAANAAEPQQIQAASQTQPNIDNQQALNALRQIMEQNQKISEEQLKANLANLASIKNPADISTLANGGSVRRHYEDGGFAGIGEAISSGLGNLAHGNSPFTGNKITPGPISKGLITAGLGMMASPQHNTLRAIGEGGLKGLQEYMSASEEQRKQQELDAQKAKQAAFSESLLPKSKGGGIRKGYAEGGGPEEFDPISAIGEGISGLGEGLGGLFKNRDEPTPKVVASDRTAPVAEAPRPRGPGPISQALMTAGLGMMASPHHNPLRAIGEGGLIGMQAFNTAAEQQRKQQALEDQKAAHENYYKKLTAEPGVAASDKEEKKPASPMDEYERILKIPATDAYEAARKKEILDALEFKIQRADKEKGKLGKIGTDEFGQDVIGYIEGPKDWIGKTPGQIRSGNVVAGDKGAEPEQGEINWKLTGDDFIKQLPESKQAYLKGIISGREKVPDNKFGRIWAQMAHQADPNFDQSDYESRKKMRVNYADTSPTKTGGQIIAGNTAIGHAGELADLALKLDNYSSDIINKPINWVKDRFGGEAAETLERYRTLVDKYAVEKTKFYQGTAGGVEERRAAREMFSPDKSPRALVGALMQDRMDMESKLIPLQETWKKTMHENLPDEVGKQYEIVGPHAKKMTATLNDAYRKTVGNSNLLLPGDVRKGYVFKGGNPKDQANWEKE